MLMLRALPSVARRLPSVARKAAPRVRLLSTAAAVEAPAGSMGGGEPAHPDPELGAFTEAFLGELGDASAASKPAESAALLSDLVRAGHL